MPSAAARTLIASRDLHGTVSVEQGSLSRLPYVDNLVNLLVAEALPEGGMDEVMRVLVPDGVAYIRKGETWTKTTKPWPDEIDQWTHYLHDSTNNAVAHDTVVGPPKHYQWHGTPRWSRHHESMSSTSALEAKPLASEATANTTRPIRNIRRRPNRSLSDPAISIAVARQNAVNFFLITFHLPSDILILARPPY